jgi:hypothetical protein
VEKNMAIESNELSNTGLPTGVTAEYSEDFGGALTLRRDGDLFFVGIAGNDEAAFVGAFKDRGSEMYRAWQARASEGSENGNMAAEIERTVTIREAPTSRGNLAEVNAPVRFSRGVVENLKSDGVWVRKTDNIHLLDGQSSGPLVVTMSLCPLYEVGNLSDSHLMSSPARIEDSRVSPKWTAGINAIESIQHTSAQRGQDVEVVLTFADRGTISRDPEREDPEILDHHFHVYQQAAEIELGEKGIRYQLQRYSNIFPEHPMFIPASEKVIYLSPDQVSAEADLLVQRLAEAGVVFEPSVVDISTATMSKKARKIIEGLMRLKGNPDEIGYAIELAEGFIYQYGAFDSRTTRPDALNLFIERESAGLLLQLTDLFAHSRAPRVDILV